MSKQENSLELEKIKPELNPVDISKKDDLRELIEKNIKWSQVVYEQTKKINRRITLMMLGSYLRLLLILLPLVLAFIFLPPIINNLWSKYGSLLGGVGGGGIPKIQDINPEQILKLLNDNGIKLNLSPSEIQNYLSQIKK